MSLIKQLSEASAKRKVQNELQPYMYQTKEEIEHWMKNATVKGFVNREMEIEAAERDTDIGRFGMKSKDVLINVNGKWVLPVKFRLTGNFDMGHVEIDSFEGFPHVVMGKLECNSAKVDNLDGLPALVTGGVRLMFRHSHLKNLIGFPQTSGSKIEVWLGSRGTEEHSSLESLEGISSGITELSIGMNFWNIKDIIQHCTDLKGLWLMSKVDWTQNPTFLSVFKLPELMDIFIGPKRAGIELDPDTIASDIITKHLKSEDRSVLDCKEELYAEGLKLYARST
jgi:hypothetical protein